jgi:hypothetical protein
MRDFRDLIHDPVCKSQFEELLRLAAGLGDAAEVVERLSWGIDPNCANGIGETPLICNVTSFSPSAAVVAALLKAGADPSHMDRRGLTALDYARRKLAEINLEPRTPPRRSRSLDENGQLIVSKVEQQMFNEARKKHPKMAKEFITSFIKRRVKVAKTVYNDPVEVEKTVELLEEAERKAE